MTITLRSTKQAPLTHAEVDQNFQDLDFRSGAGWNDIVSEMFTRLGPQCPDVGNFRDGIYLYEFPTGVNREVYANFHLIHDYKPGSMVYPHVHWTLNSNAAGTVRWVWEYTLARRHASTGMVTFPATQTLVLEQAVPANSAYTHFVTESPEGQGIPGTHLETDAVILSRIYRDGEHVNDTLDASAFGIVVDLHYECDRFATPSRFPPFT